MDAITECFVSGCLVQVLHLARLFGVAPLSFIKKKTGWRVRFSHVWSIYGYCFVTGVISLPICAVIFDIYLEQQHSFYMKNYMLKVVWLTELFVTMSIAGTSVYRAPESMRSMIACLSHIQKINIEVNIRHWPGSQDVERKKIYLFIAITVVNLILRFADVELYLNQDKNETNIYKFYMFYHFGTWITQMQLTLIVMLIHHVVYSFRAINDDLILMLYDPALSKDKCDEEMLHIMNPYVTPMNKEYKDVYADEAKYIVVSQKTHPGGNKSRSSYERINSLAQVYVSTCDVVQEVDRCHGLVMLMMLASYLFYLVITPYYLLNALLHANTSQNTLTDFIKGVLQLMWCIVHLTNLIMLIEPCHLTQMEMETTRELVSRLMFCTHSVYDPLAVELERFSRHLMLNQASYSPMKVVTLERSIGATILGSITTYLVIVFQL